MARPAAGPPPVTSSVAAPERPRKDLETYMSIVEGFQRPDRMEALRAMFGGSDDLVQRFLAVALNAISTDSDLLLNATPASIIQAVKDSATLGLEPTGLTGEAVIIRRGDQAKLTPMYRGYLKRVRNSGKVEDIGVGVVYTGDRFTHGYTERGFTFTHEPVVPDPKAAPEDDVRGDFAGAYAYLRFPSGFVDGRFMPTIDLYAIRDRYSESWNGSKREKSPWATSPAEMMIKTVLRNVLKRAPQMATDQTLQIMDQLDNDADSAVGDGAVNAFDMTKARRTALAALAGRTGAPMLEPGAAAPEQPAGDPAGEPPEAPEGLDF